MWSFSCVMPKPPGSIRLAQVQLKAWHKVLLEEVADDILKTAKVMAVQTSGLIRLPTKISRWSLIRSPFVHKSHWDQVPPAAQFQPITP